MKTFIFSAHSYEVPFLKEAADGKHELLLSQEKLSIDTVHLAHGCEAIAIFTADDASSAVLQQLYDMGIRHVALRSTGYDHVDLMQAKKLAIHVANVPEYSPYAIAEHAVALLLALNRKILTSQSQMQQKDFRLDNLVGFDIHGKTIGIIGTGTIGMTFAKIMTGFGANLVGYDPVQNPVAADIGLQYVTLDELYNKSDIISIHCPLNEHTRHLISMPQLKKMKRDCIIINTARGGVLHTYDLLEALENNQIGGACLDVYEKEKGLFFEDHRNNSVKDELFEKLRINKKVIITGHQAFLTREALKGIADTTMKNLDYWAVGKRSIHELNR